MKDKSKKENKKEEASFLEKITLQLQEMESRQLKQSQEMEARMAQQQSQIQRLLKNQEELNQQSCGRLPSLRY